MIAMVWKGLIHSACPPSMPHVLTPTISPFGQLLPPCCSRSAQCTINVQLRHLRTANDGGGGGDAAYSSSGPKPSPPVALIQLRPMFIRIPENSPISVSSTTPPMQGRHYSSPSLNAVFVSSPKGPPAPPWTMWRKWCKPL